MVYRGQKAQTSARWRAFGVVGMGCVRDSVGRGSVFAVAGRLDVVVGDFARDNSELLVPVPGTKR